MRRLAISLLVIFTTIAVAACGGGASPTPASSTAVTPSAAGSPAASVPAASAGSASAGSAAACATAPAGSTAAATVTIKGFAYSPQPVQAKVGDVIAWKNEDGAPHSATMDDNSCDTGTISSGASAMLVFTAAGTYTYHCKVHPTQMKDVTVEVK
jgi:plastocyanin